MNLITDTAFRNVTLASVAQERATTHPDDTALLFDSGVRLSYGDAWKQANQLAQAIQQLGVEPGATLTFQLPNIPESVPLAIAASICGLVINPVVPIYRGKELGFILSDAKTEILFIPHRIRGFDFVDMIRELRSGLPDLRHVVCCCAEDDLPDDVLRFEALINEASDAPAPIAAVDPDDTKVVLYTSGTTGNPKAVRHSHNTLAKALDNGVMAWGLDERDMMLMPSPVTHVTGYVNGIELPFFTDTNVLLMETGSSIARSNLSRPTMPRPVSVRRLSCASLSMPRAIRARIYPAFGSSPVAALLCPLHSFTTPVKCSRIVGR